MADREERPSDRWPECASLPSRSCFAVPRADGHPVGARIGPAGRLLRQPDADQLVSRDRPRSDARRARPNLVRWFPSLLAADVLFLAVSRNVVLPGSSVELRFTSAVGSLSYLVLLGVFFLNAALFVPLGEQIGQQFERLPNLRAYAWDLGGSLAGTLVFGLFAVRTSRLRSAWRLRSALRAPLSGPGAQRAHDRPVRFAMACPSRPPSGAPPGRPTAISRSVPTLKPHGPLFSRGAHAAGGPDDDAGSAIVHPFGQPELLPVSPHHRYPAIHAGDAGL